MRISKFLRFVIPAISGVLVLVSTPTLSQEVSGPHDDADVEEIESQIGKVITALRTRNAGLYASIYLEDADYINTSSAHHVGADAIRREAQDIIANAGENLANFDLPITGIRFVSEEIAVVDCFVPSTGGRATYYMIKHPDTWYVFSARIVQAEGE